MQRPCDAIDTMLMPSSTVMNSVVILVRNVVQGRDDDSTRTEHWTLTSRAEEFLRHCHRAYLHLLGKVPACCVKSTFCVAVCLSVIYFFWGDVPAFDWHVELSDGEAL